MADILRENEYAALGRVAVAAARLDAVIELFLSDAITHDSQVGITVAKGLPFERKTRMLTEILALRLPESEDRAALKPLIEEAANLMRERNTYVHGLWQFDADSNLEVKNRLRKNGEFRIRSVSVDDLNRTAIRLDELSALIEDLYLEMLVDLGAFTAVTAGVWRRVAPHRPHGFVLDGTGSSGLVVDFSNVE
ncbi:hypothetical protein ASD65_06275 [Microbacterium sp. Root61]|uniref:hypothetical protein n=1 Tax=Microbacterium sp. Root61 TaxID=1736570 RepID=UPI0006F8B3C4|nr:hypothetical protein [Microbacterium sp. Root61]KRA24075.1 hypothetical protein ASD65_06275 [Microbacterium sp. Root61]